MKKYIYYSIFSISIILLLIPLLIAIIKKNDNTKIGQQLKVEIYTIYLDGEVTKKGEIEVLSTTKLGDVIPLYTTPYSDLSSFNSNEYVINNKVYNIAYKNKININIASEDELSTLEGIGSVRALQIIKLRPYSKIDDLITKGVLTSGVYEKIKNEITV